MILNVCNIIVDRATRLVRERYSWPNQVISSQLVKGDDYEYCNIFWNDIFIASLWPNTEEKDAVFLKLQNLSEIANSIGVDDNSKYELIAWLQVLVIIQDASLSVSSTKIKTYIDI